MTMNPLLNSSQNHASGNANTLLSHGTNNTKICSSLPSTIPSVVGLPKETEDFIFIFIR